MTFEREIHSFARREIEEDAKAKAGGNGVKDDTCAL